MESISTRRSNESNGSCCLGLLARTARRWILALAVFALLAHAAAANAGAYETVRSAEQFAIGGVGVTGVTSPEELAFRALRDGLQAEEKFRELLHDGTPAGQMYALFGLRQIGAADYATLSEPYRRSSTPVRVISGCTIHTDPASEIVRWIDQWAKKIRTWEKP